MKLIDSLGPFRYEISGEKEQDAAEYLENALNFLSHDYSGDFSARWADVQETARQKFGVSIKIHEED